MLCLIVTLSSYCAEHLVVPYNLDTPSALKTFFLYYFCLSSLSFLCSLFIELPLIIYVNFHINFYFLISFQFSISLFFSSTFCCILLSLSSRLYVELSFFFFLADIFISNMFSFFYDSSLIITHYSYFKGIIYSLRALIV